MLINLMTILYQSELLLQEPCTFGLQVFAFSSYSTSCNASKEEISKHYAHNMYLLGLHLRVRTPAMDICYFWKGLLSRFLKCIQYLCNISTNMQKETFKSCVHVYCKPFWPHFRVRTPILGIMKFILTVELRQWNGWLSYLRRWLAAPRSFSSVN